MPTSVELYESLPRNSAAICSTGSFFFTSFNRVVHVGLHDLYFGGFNMKLKVNISFEPLRLSSFQQSCTV